MAFEPSEEDCTTIMQNIRSCVPKVMSLSCGKVQRDYAMANPLFLCTYRTFHTNHSVYTMLPGPKYTRRMDTANAEIFHDAHTLARLVHPCP
jgi:hypothetical protein